jgi:hypothetical protein
MKLVRVLAGLPALLLLGAGCAGQKYAPVSGVVTLDGTPYKNAIVSFQPLGDVGDQNPGRGSSALTDQNGRFTLMTVDGQPGAAVGKHRVRIQTSRDFLTGPIDPNVGSPDDPQVAKGKADPIPVDWYSDVGGREFVVPAGGTDKANFEIVTKKK